MKALQLSGKSTAWNRQELKRQWLVDGADEREPWLSRSKERALVSVNKHLPSKSLLKGEHWESCLVSVPYFPSPAWRTQPEIRAAADLLAM